MEEILFKIHKSYRWVVAICDKEVYGRVLNEKEKKLDLTGEFFNGEEMNRVGVMERIIDCVKEDATFNIVGENSIKIAKEAGIINDDGIGEIEGVPFALVLL